MTIVRVVGPVYGIGINRGPQEVGLLVQWLDQSGFGVLRNNRIPQISSTSPGTIIEIEEGWAENPQKQTESEA